MSPAVADRPAISTRIVRTYGVGSALAILAAASVLVLAVAVTTWGSHGLVLAGGLIAAIDTYLVLGYFWPRLVVTVLTWALVAPLTGMMAGIYATGPGVPFLYGETFLRMLVWMGLLAAVAARLRGSVVPRLICAAAAVAAGLPLTGVLPDGGVFVAYAVAAGGLLIPTVLSAAWARVRALRVARSGPVSAA